MKFNKKFSILALFLMLVFVACTNGNDKNTDNKVESANETNTESTDSMTQSAATEVEITDNKGTQTIPVDPKSVVVLDSRSFETIANWGVKPAALPKDVMPADNPLKNDDNIPNIGNHREPNFEVLASVNPEVVIIGQRFGSHYDAIKELLPNAKILDIDIDLKNDNPGTALVTGLKRNTEILGKVFNKNNEAMDLITKFDKALNDAKSKKADSKFVGLIVSGGNIGYSAPVSGRVWGPVFSELSLTPALKLDDTSSDHKGDDISVESIAESNPDAILVLDRDAAISSTESAPAKDVVEGSQVLKSTNALKNNKVFYAPNDTYTNESIQTWTEVFEGLSNFLSNLSN